MECLLWRAVDSGGFTCVSGVYLAVDKTTQELLSPNAVVSVAEFCQDYVEAAASALSLRWLRCVTCSKRV